MFMFIANLNQQNLAYPLRTRAIQTKNQLDCLFAEKPLNILK